MRKVKTLFALRTNRFDAQLAIKTVPFRPPIVLTNGGKHFDDGQNDVKMISREKQSF